MNSFVVYPLLILVVIGSFTQIYNFGENYDLSGSNSTSQELITSQTLNGTSQELELEEGSLDLSFNMTVGIVATIAGAIALGLIGLKFLGSGLSDFSVKIIWNGIVYYGLWLIFSVLGYNVLVSIPFLGVLLWFFLTLIYSLGVFGKMGGEN